MSERPIERLNYYNGQRLEAEDFRLEQEYHLRIQRWLMKSLFSPGVADGLDVYPSGDKKKVFVTPGLALDDLGRAIINVNPVELVPQAPFLCVRYLERKTALEEGSCKTNGGVSAQDVRWGGPARIFSDAEFVWRRGFPQVDARELVIAELSLNPDCSVNKVVSGPKRRAVAASRVVAPYAVIGEKDIDEPNPKNIFFHVKQASAQVFLYLRASQFSTLHYTEMPSHPHRLISRTTDPVTHQPDPTQIEVSTEGDHAHDLANVTIDHYPHSHDIESNFLQLSGNQGPNPDKIHGNDDEGAVVVDMEDHGHFLLGPPFTDRLSLHTTASKNSPDIAGSMGNAGEHSHTIVIDTSTEAVGAKGIGARNSKQITYPTSLTISFVVNGAPTDITDAVIDYLQNHGDSAWKLPGIVSIGDGTGTHPLVMQGTGPIPLHDFFDIGLGENNLELSVKGDGNGGCIHYNLYIE